MSSAKPVLISGAGLGGLLLAQSLRSHRIPFKLYERDSAGSSRAR
jgi:2-polyprenyl-6-methoxyphenol hydroxylase-like FAD-dependent oxidoreductase